MFSLFVLSYKCVVASLAAVKEHAKDVRCTERLRQWWRLCVCVRWWVWSACQVCSERHWAIHRLCASTWLAEVSQDLSTELWYTCRVAWLLQVSDRLIFLYSLWYDVICQLDVLDLMTHVTCARLVSRLPACAECVGQTCRSRIGIL